MKTLLILCLLLSAQTLYSQSINLFYIDTSGFPLMKAKFYAFDATGNQVRPSASELSLKENGTARTITNVSCPPPVPPKALSSVLVIDVSGSMSRGATGIPNIDLAKAAARAWVNGLPLGTSECAIASFDHSNYLNQDFTTNRAKLLGAINPLQPQGGTDYDMALLNPMAGGLLVSKTGKYTKVLVFISDGQPNYEPNTSTIISEAKNQGCIIYVVTLGLPAPQSLKDIAAATGGQVFENVTSVQEAEDVYRTILQVAQGGSPCTIEWQSGISCQAGSTSVELSWQSEKSQGSYTYPSKALVALQVSPSFIGFGSRALGTSHDTTITLTARNADFTIMGVNRKYGSTDYTIMNTNFPLFIPKDESRTITLRFAPTDSSLSYASFEISTDKCPAFLSANGGFPGKKAKLTTLKLIHPNGGEKFVAGSDTLITWTGISPTDTVRLDYSIDGGKIWKNITDKAFGLQYHWKNIPLPTSNQCLIRVTQISTNSNDTVRTLKGHTHWVSSVAFSPDGSKLASGSWNGDGTIKIWDANTGKELQTLPGPKTIVFSVAFSPDGSKLASGSGDNSTVKIWDANTGALLQTLTGHNDYYVTSVAFSPDGRKIASGSDDSTIKIWDVVTRKELRTLTGHTNRVKSVAYSPDGRKIASGSSDNTIKIWDANTGAELRTLMADVDGVRSVAFSPDGSTIVADEGSSGGWGGRTHQIKIWDANTGAVLQTLRGHINSPVTSVAYSPDGRKIASGSSDNTIKIWDASTGAELRTLTGHTGSVYSVAYSPDGSMLASGSQDRTIKIWEIESVLQQDQSDAVFSIVAPQAASQDIDLGKVLVGGSKDSVVNNFVRNIGSWKFRVDSIYFRGADANAFRLVSGVPSYTVAANNHHFAEFRFIPQKIGVHNADIVIITQTDTLVQTITGIGIAPQLQIMTTIIDFGKVEIGNEKIISDTVVLKNISTNSIDIIDTKQLSPDIEQFSVLSGDGGFTLSPQEERKVTLRFKPKYGGRTSGRIGFEYNGTGSPAIAQLFGTGIGGIITVPDDSGYAGERKILRVMMNNVKPAGIASIAPKYEATLRFQHTIMASMMGVNTIKNDSNYVTIQGTIGTNAELAQIPIIVGLGNVTETNIDIVQFRLLDENGKYVDYDFETQSGKFTLLGICEEGGTRLINPGKATSLMRIHPNPSKGIMSVDLELIEQGLTKVRIMDIQGNVMVERELIDAIGSTTVLFDMEKYGAGVYYIEVRTPTIIRKEKIVIEK